MSRDPAPAAVERAVLLTLASVQITSIIDFVVIMPLAPELMRALDMNPAQFGLVLASYTWSAGLAGVVASSQIDRFGRKAAFLGLYVGFLAGTLFCGLAPTYGLLLTARVVTGAFGGILGGMAMAIVGDVFPEERRGRASGALMSAFSIASIAGVPIGIVLGNAFDWHAPFLVLAALGLPVLALGAWALPPLTDHLGKPRAGTGARLWEMYSHPNHLRAFALVVALMFGTFLVVPYISAYLVGNAGLTKEQLPWIYVGGGVCSLVTSPLVGRWADRSGKLRVYRYLAPASALVMILITVLPRAGLGVAVAAVSMLMVVNTGRMVAAMALVIGSVEPRLRGGFMSAYSSVQHVACGIGTFVAGLILVEGPGKSLERYWVVGLIGAVSTLLSVFLAGRLRPASEKAAPVDPLGEIAMDPVPAAEAF